MCSLFLGSKLLKRKRLGVIWRYSRKNNVTITKKKVLIYIGIKNAAHNPG